MRKMNQVVDINLSNYDRIIDKFVSSLKIDSDIKRVNFMVFKDNASYSDNIIPFMKKSDYLKKRLKEESLMFNLVEANIKVCDAYAIRTLLTKNSENLSVVLLDAYGKTLVKDKWNKTNLFKLVNKEVSNIKHILKMISRTNNMASIYVLGMPRVENETSRVSMLIHKLVRNVYKEIIKKYPQVNYIETTIDENKNRVITNAIGFNQLAYLLHEISETLYVNQTRILLEKSILAATNNGEKDINSVLKTAIKAQYDKGLSTLVIERGLNLYSHYTNQKIDTKILNIK